MNTNIQGVYNGFSVANLAQVLAYTEGSATRTLNPITLTTSTNYSRVYTLTLTVISANYANINIAQTVTAGPLLVKSGAVYTISSEYVNAQGVKINNWAYFKLAIQGLTLQFANTDWGDTFDIQAVFTDGATTESSIIQVVTTAVPDVTGSNQTLTVPMAMNGKSLVGLGGVNLAINDVNQAGKTYRTTYTVNNSTNATGTSQMKLGIQHGGTTTAWQNTYSLTGTQAYINGQIAGNGADYDGLFFVNYTPDFQGQTSVSYVQEVLTTTEVGVTVPYVQETGNLVFNTTYTAPYAIGSNPTYVEDGSVTFSLGSITDLSGTNYAHETCGVYQGYNCYTVTATVQGSFSGTNPVVLTYAGDAGVNNSVTFTGSKTSVNAQLASVQLIPPADYTDPLTIQVVVTRGNTPVTIYTGNITATCSSVHNEFSIIGGVPFVIGNNDINFGSITDAATAKNYTVTIDCGQSSATYGTLTDLSGLGTWNGTGGTGGFGRLTITGTKTVVNASLAAIRYTTGSGSALTNNIVFTYTQTQNTNVISQGSNTINVNNAFVWGSGNTGSGFVFDENTKITYDLGNINTTITGTAKAEITLSTAFSVANGGSLTGWTRFSDTVWTFTGTKAAVNAALAATEIIPPADRVTSFTVDMKIYDDAVVKYDSVSFSATKTFAIRNTYSKFNIISSHQLSTFSASDTINIGSITDVRPDNISSAITYSVVLTPSSVTNISLSAGGSGGTSVWNGSTLTLTGTKTQVNSRLATLIINFEGINNFTITYAQTQTTNSVSQGSTTCSIIKPIPGYMFTSPTHSVRTFNFTSYDVGTLPITLDAYNHNASYGKGEFIVGAVDATVLKYNKSTISSWTSASVGGADVGYKLQTSKYGNSKRVLCYQLTDGAEASGYKTAIYTSSDDSTFTKTLTLSDKYSFLSFANGIFFIVSLVRFDPVSYPTMYMIRLYKSTDGVTWSSDLISGKSQQVRQVPISYSGNLEQTYSVEYTSDGYWRFTSRYVNWVNFTDPTLCRTQVWYSLDGSGWNSKDLYGAYHNEANTKTGYILQSPIMYDNTYYVTLNQNGAAISTDADVWEGGGTANFGSATVGTYGNVNNPLAFGNSIWLAVCQNTLYRASTNIYSWSVVNNTINLGFTPYAIHSLRFLDGKFYMIVSTTYNNTILMSSTNGLSWSTVYTFASGEMFIDIAYTG